MRIRAAIAEDPQPLLDIWFRSAHRTHRFLTEQSLEALVPDVRNYLTHSLAQIWVLCADPDQPIGFMGLSARCVDALFIAPEWLRRGGGRLLLAHARGIAGGPLSVDVNQDNPAAISFYRASGFAVVGASPTDSAGRPYPILHMRETIES